MLLRATLKTIEIRKNFLLWCETSSWCVLITSNRIEQMLSDLINEFNTFKCNLIMVFRSSVMSFKMDSQGSVRVQLHTIVDNNGWYSWINFKWKMIFDSRLTSLSVLCSSSMRIKGVDLNPIRSTFRILLCSLIP